MASKNRKKIANIPQESKSTPSDDSPLLANKPSLSDSEVVDLKAGNIVVTWNDGNVSQLFQNASIDEDQMAPDEKVNGTE
ncbi:unnamed protein product [Tetraodon nigroviridis]|uniref:(spotted green pufferfish) hypothetical protein n=1 Tax=Tetraodon nigroviridis TaxID=99883 RepID=Q4RZE7_TETNG|nr:unnamed protein product [Tetraodon nigroviridis]